MEFDVYDECLLSITSCSLRDRAQVEQLLRYIVEEAPEDAESKRAFKFVTLHRNSIPLFISFLYLLSRHGFLSYL